MRLPSALIAIALGLVVSIARAQDAQPRLWDAAISGDTATLRQAIAAGAKVDSLDTRRGINGRRALNWAALNNQVPAIQLLLAAGASIDAANRTGFTALHHAAEFGTTEAAQALLAAGANATLTNQAGLTPAAVAQERGFGALATILEAAERSPRPARP